MTVWVFEANNPVGWSAPYFSPIVAMGGSWVCYIGGYNLAKFYRYNLDTNAWTELANPPGVIWGGIAMSPDKTKMVAHLSNGSQLWIYTVGGGWTTSAVAPLFRGLFATNIQSAVFLDNDTLWVHLRALDGANQQTKCYRYVISTDTWTQYPNYKQLAYTNSQCICINTAGTVLYFGQCGADYTKSYKYTIATDTYAEGPSLPAAHYFVTSADRGRLWLGPKTGGFVTMTKWVNPDTEVLESDVFPAPPERDKVSNLSGGVHDLTVAIAAYHVAEPKNMSYTGEAAPSGSVGGINSGLLEVLSP